MYGTSGVRRHSAHFSLCSHFTAYTPPGAGREGSRGCPCTCPPRRWARPTWRGRGVSATGARGGGRRSALRARERSSAPRVRSEEAAERGFPERRARRRVSARRSPTAVSDRRVSVRVIAKMTRKREISTFAKWQKEGAIQAIRDALFRESFFFRNAFLGRHDTRPTRARHAHNAALRQKPARTDISRQHDRHKPAQRGAGHPGPSQRHRHHLRLQIDFLPDTRDLARLRAVSCAMRDAVDATGRPVYELTRKKPSGEELEQAAAPAGACSPREA